MVLLAGRYEGELYRAVNPVYARDPLSGYGAQNYGGRFNPKGTPALYLALEPMTALREANQVGSLQPTVLVAYRADLYPIFDTRDVSELIAQGISSEALADPRWRSAMLDGDPVPTQRFAVRLIARGFAGLLVRSFARGAKADETNIVLWRWKGPNSKLSVIDDQDRLNRM